MPIATTAFDNALKNVSTVQYHGKPSDHIASFVRPADAPHVASGKCFHVIHIILADITFGVRERESPLVAPNYVVNTMSFVSTVEKSDVCRFEEICFIICKSVLQPEAQLKLNSLSPPSPLPLRKIPRSRCGGAGSGQKRRLRS